MTLRAALVAAALLVFAPSALAKGPSQICGASGCAVLGAETAAPVGLSLDSTAAPVGPVAPAPYYVVQFADASVKLAYWVPSASVLRLLSSGGSPSWAFPSQQEATLLREKTAGLRPYPAPTRTTVLVDWDVVKRPTGYLALFTAGTAVGAVPPGTRWLDIRVGGGASPWNDGMTSFAISRRGNLLRRDGDVVQISADLARRIRARLPFA